MPDTPPLPEVGIRWSKKMILTLLIVSILIAFCGVFGYLYYKERHKLSTGDFGLPIRQIQSQTKLYTNDYWGFKFSYPAFWYPLISSYQDGDYYFASEPINFVKEHSNDQALMEIKTYNNLKNLSFDDWINDQLQNYIPAAAVLKRQTLTVGGQPAVRLLLQFQKPQNTIEAWDMIVVEKNNYKIYEFVLQTANLATHDSFQGVFEGMAESVQFYQGFGS